MRQSTTFKGFFLLALATVVTTVACDRKTEAGEQRATAEPLTQAAPATEQKPPAAKPAPEVGVAQAEGASGAPAVFGQRPEIGARAKCPVMGGEFKVGENTDISEYRGKYYAFCCPGCKPKFDADPEKYIAGIATATGSGCGRDKDVCEGKCGCGKTDCGGECERRHARGDGKCGCGKAGEKGECPHAKARAEGKCPHDGIRAGGKCPHHNADGKCGCDKGGAEGKCPHAAADGKCGCVKAEGKGDCPYAKAKGKCPCGKAGCAHHGPGKAGAAPTSFDKRPAIGTRAKCPVMGGEFEVGENTDISEYRGKFYAFCCPGCKPKFDADPEKYL